MESRNKPAKFFRIISLTMAIILLFALLPACEQAVEDTVLIAPTLNPDEMRAKVITEDEKWGRPAPGMAAVSGGTVKEYDGKLGYGYNMITSPFFGPSEYINLGFPVLDMTKLAKDTDRVFLDLNEYEVKTKTYIHNSKRAYSSEMAASASATGYSLTGSITVNFDMEKSEQITTDQYLMTLQALKQIRKEYILNPTASTLASYVMDAFSKDVDYLKANPTKDNIAQFIERYGTHILATISMGGRMDLNYLYTATQNTSQETIQSSFSGETKFVKGSASAYVAKSADEMSKISRINICTYGGLSPVDPFSITGAMNDYKAWEKSITDDNATLVGADRTIAIWDLVGEMKNGGEELKNAIFNYCEDLKEQEINSLGSSVTKYIKNVYVGYGSTAYRAKEMLKQRGVLYDNIVDMDLNRSCGGDYVYIGYTTTTKESEAIRSLKALWFDEDRDLIRTFYSGKAKFTLVQHVDLNKEAGGPFIYLYYTKDACAGKPLVSIIAENLDANVNTGSATDGYSIVQCNYEPYINGMDMNYGAGGDDIFLWFKKAS